MQTLSFSLSCDISLQEMASELSKMNLSGTVWIDYDKASKQVCETLVNYWLQYIGHKAKTIQPSKDFAQPHYIYEHKSQILKPVFYTDLKYAENTDKLSLESFYQYMQDVNALAIITGLSGVEADLPQPYLVINIKYIDGLTCMECTLTEIGQKAEMNLERLDVDNVCFSTRVIFSRTTDAHKNDDRVIDILNGELNYQKIDYTLNLFNQLLNGIFPYQNVSTMFYMHLFFRITFSKNGRTLLSFNMDYGDYLHHSLWDCGTFGVPNNSELFRVVLNKINGVDYEEEFEINDAFSNTEIRYIETYESNNGSTVDIDFQNSND